MPTFHDVLVDGLGRGLRDASWLPEIEASPDEDALKLRFGTDRFSKKILRLTADSATAALLANPHSQEFATALARVRRITDVRSARYASVRLRKIAARVVHAGEIRGEPYRGAAWLAELVGECYENPGFSYEYFGVADQYMNAARGGFDESVRPVILRLLADVHAVEKRAASALG